MTKILVVDAEVDDLSDDGLDVISAHDGAAALEQIYREPPDVVLLDLLLPVLNGYEVIQEPRGNPTTRNLPVIMLTAVPPSEGSKPLCVWAPTTT